MTVEFMSYAATHSVFMCDPSFEQTSFSLPMHAFCEVSLKLALSFWMWNFKDNNDDKSRQEAHGSHRSSEKTLEKMIKFPQCFYTILKLPPHGKGLNTDHP